MNFGSKHVYAYEHSDEESISDNELEEGMYLSDSGGSGDELGFSIPRMPVQNVDEADQERREFKSISVTARRRCAAAPSPPAIPPRTYRSKKTHVRWADDHAGMGHHVRRADTNILTVRFDKLKEPSLMHTGDAVICGHCPAVFSHLSVITNRNGEQSDDESRVWVCEFCSHSNAIDLMAEEIPTEEDVTYMLEPASLAEGATGGSEDKTSVLFCIDVSGSMCVTTEIPGSFNLRGAERNRADPGDDQFDAFQQMMGRRRDVTYISRLQGVQAAIDKQLETMKKRFPERGVALIAFNNEVTVIGDGSQPPTVIAGDKLNDKDTLIKLGKEAVLPQAIGKVGDALSDKVFSLEEGGATALGPALLFSVMMASQQPGSKVIICTDGLANVGLGSLDELVTDEQHEAAQQFYDDVGQLAVDAGVSVSVVTIEGTECRMVQLGQVADKTGGQVSVVDPIKLTQEFGNLLANPVIATNVSLTLILHNGLCFRNEETSDNRITRHVGNVTAESEISFEFGVRKSAKESPLTTEAEKQPEVKVVVTDTDADQENQEQGEPQASACAATSESDVPAGTANQPSSLSALSELPFQLQMEYIGMDGSKSLRVISKSQPVTRDRQVAEQDMDVGVIGVHAAQTAASMAIEGHYTNARASSLAQQRLVQRWSHQTANRDGYVNWFANVAPMEKQLRGAQQRERRTHGHSYSDEEDGADEACASGLAPLESRALTCPVRPALLGAQAKKPATKKIKSLNRRKECSDETATMIYRMRAVSSKTFSSVEDTDERKSTEEKSKLPKESSV